MKKAIMILAVTLLMGTVLTLSGCGLVPWHGHGRGGHRYGPDNNTSARYWHGPQYGYSHYGGCGHPGY